MLLRSILALVAVATQAFGCPPASVIAEDLQRRLTANSSIVGSSQQPGRWSEYRAPLANVTVNVGCEEDIATVVKYCNQHGIQYLAQNGGNSWSDTFNLGQCGILINLAGLNGIVFNKDNTKARIQAGITVQQIVDAAYSHNTRIANPTCPCLGFLGAVLGGGLTRMAGLYGWGVDQIESVDIVLGSGETVQASRNNRANLFWAILGAAPNFGIVTSAIVKAYPTAAEQNVAWQGPIIYSEDKLESLITAIDDLHLTANMQLDILLFASGAPSYTPQIMVFVFYLGNAAQGRAAFAPLFDVGPVTSNTTEVPYSHWNDWSSDSCTKGGRKPVYGVSSDRLDPSLFKQVFDNYSAFIAQNGAEVGLTAILVEHYNTQKAVEIGDKHSSFPYRALSFHTTIIPWYQNEALDEAANAWADETRSLLRTNNGLQRNSTYINFAHGDESLDIVYGQNLARLQKLKARYDPQNRFNQWYPLA